MDKIERLRQKIKKWESQKPACKNAYNETMCMSRLNMLIQDAQNNIKKLQGKKIKPVKTYGPYKREDIIMIDPITEYILEQQISNQSKKLSAKSLPAQVLKFAQSWPMHIKKKYPKWDITHTYVKNNKLDIPTLDKLNKDALWNLQQYGDSGCIELVNDKLLYMFYDDNGWERVPHYWYSLKDSLIYRNEESSFHKGKPLKFKPIPFNNFFALWKTQAIKPLASYQKDMPSLRVEW